MRAVLEPNRHPPESDEQLLARLRAGERDCFGVLVRRYERELFGYLRRYLGDDDLADDVFQNTFVQVYTKLGQYEPDRPVRPWLYAIATNQAIDALRRRNRRADQRADVVTTADEDGQPRPLFELLPAAGDEPPAAADRAEQRELVRAAVDRLPELLRQVVLLAYFQGLKYRDVADALGIPVGTVKSRLHAALAKLTEGWGAAHDGPGEPGVEKNDEETGVHAPSSA
ncbi:RNA polymerase subunit sigma-70 [Gemmata obscuriglobus]|uniref:RNA polymerase subunit sigma-70 n=1 Tax=Gemmata obscuriglobus TaxID=114 RepID=A0A2Z3H6J1_9BACT|nr:RNA polymerase subunit sigma-70 [Gemmata obscuriglobus]